LDEFPEIWQHYGDLGGLCEQAWVEQISGPDLRLRESLRYKLNAFKKGLAGPTPSPMETLLVERAAICWLQTAHADLLEASATSLSTALAQLRLRRMDCMQRRLLHALKTLAMVHRLGADLHVEVRHIGAEPAAGDVAADPSSCASARGSAGRSSLEGLRIGRLFEPAEAEEIEAAVAP
jgi:hypothetical protein